MTAAIQPDWQLTPEEYLAAEALAETKHEYEHGRMYAMAGVTAQHDLLAVNITTELHRQLRGKGCRVFTSDMKVRVRFLDSVRFYYPDAMVVCGEIQRESVFQDDPVVIFEVLSPSTERIDRGEKRSAYCSVDSMKVYVLVETERLGLTVYRRIGESWEAELLLRAEDVLDLSEVGCSLPLSEIYAESGLWAPRAAGDSA